MIYPYRCIQCGRDYEIVKPMAESGREEICPTCSLVLQRVFTVPQVSIPNNEGYNPATGAGQRKLEDSKKAYADKNDGSEMIPVGNDYESGFKLKPKQQSYELPREVMANFED